MSSEKNIEHKMSRAVEQLADPKSYNLVCHEHRMGEPLPSIRISLLPKKKANRPICAKNVHNLRWTGSFALLISC